MGRGAEGLGTRLAAPFAVQDKQMASAVPSPIYKVILAGKRGVGKSTLYDYLVKNMEPGGGTYTSYSLPDSTAGQWDKWLFNVPGPRRAKKIKVYLWDTGGMETYGIQNIPPAYFKKSHAAMLVYDPGESSSLRALPEWMKVIQESNVQKVVFSLWRNDMGNEMDIKEEAEKEFLQQNKMKKLLYFQVSTNSEENIRESFETLVRATHKEHKDNWGTLQPDMNSIEMLNLEADLPDCHDHHDQRGCKPC